MDNYKPLIFRKQTYFVLETLCLKHAISHTDAFIFKGKKQTQTNKYQQKFSLKIALINVETVSSVAVH